MILQHKFCVAILLAVATLFALAAPALAQPAPTQPATPVTQRTPDGKILIGVYWANLDKVRTWVVDRGVNTLLYCQGRISGRGRADWEDLHKLVEQLRAEGHVVWVIRPPSYRFELRPGEIPLGPEFDAKWRHHLLALSETDEIEDKVRAPDGRKRHLSVPADVPIIQRTILAAIADMRAQRPGYPIFINFNGEHLANMSQRDADFFGPIVRALDRVACDNWRGTVREVMMPGGVPRYGFDQRFRSIENLKTLAAGVGCAVHGYFDTVNQKIYVGKPDGEWFDRNQGLRYELSRAPTEPEMRRMAARWADIGWFYFAIQPNHGVNDGTSPETAALLLELAAAVNPARSVADVLRDRLAAVEAERDAARDEAAEARRKLATIRRLLVELAAESN